MNPRIEPQQLNTKIDPFIVFLNSRIEDKEEDVDIFMTIQDINGYFGLEDENYSDLRVFLEECSKIPKKFSLNLIELNYLYCTLLWDKGFRHLTKKLLLDAEYKNGFFKIINYTVQEIFDYKTYVRDLKINKYTAKSWMKFYENLLEFNDINVNYKMYDQQTIVKIKERNFFFNDEKCMTENWFFRLYKNLEEILRALDHSIFYFHVDNDYIMTKVKFISQSFKEILLKDLYGAVFYLFMRDDQFFVERLRLELIKQGFFLQNFDENFEHFVTKFDNYIETVLRTENNFSMDAVLETKEPVARYLPSTNPLYSFNQNLYKVEALPEEIAKLKAKKPPTVEEFNQMAKQRSESMETFRKNILNNEKSLNLKIKTPKSSNRILEAQENFKGHQELFVSLDELNHVKKVTNKEVKEIRKLFKVPSQPDISDPQEFFERIDMLKKPLSLKAKRMTLTDFFNAYEERATDYYGAFANIQLLSLCKQYMESKIPAFANIFCLILQRESSLLLQ